MYGSCFYFDYRMCECGKCNACNIRDEQKAREQTTDVKKRVQLALLKNLDRTEEKRRAGKL